MTKTTAETYDIKIDDSALNEYGFRKFSLPRNGSNNNTFMTVWNEDRSKIIYSMFYRTSIDKSVKALEKKLSSSEQHVNIDDDTARNLVIYFRNQLLVLKEENPDFFNGKATRRTVKIAAKSDNQQQQHDEDKEKAKKTIFVPRYSQNNLLAEAVIVGGIPKFAAAELKACEVSVTLQDTIQIDDKTVIKPPEFRSYINRSYTFKTQKEFEQLVEKVRGKNLDIIYRKDVKPIWKKYIAADDFHISLCSADTIFTYFQDKIGLTHY